MKEEVRTQRAPPPVGPYSQAVKVGHMLFVSGQIPVDPETGAVVGGTIREQAERVMENVKAILEAAGYSMGDVVMVLAYLRDLEDFATFNEVYSRYFDPPYPARVTVQVARLPKDVLVEVAVIAARSQTSS